MTLVGTMTSGTGLLLVPSMDETGNAPQVAGCIFGNGLTHHRFTITIMLQFLCTFLLASKIN